MIKVALVSFSYPNVVLGGSSLYVFHLAEALARNAEVTVVIPNVNPDRLQLLKPKAKLLKVDIVNLPFLRSPSFMVSASRSINRRNFDVIHSSSGDGIFCRRVSVETFYHSPETLAAKIHGLPQRLSLHKAAQVIAISERTKRELLEKGVNDDRITVVEMGVDTDVFSYREGTTEDLRKSLGLPEGKIVLHVNTEFSPRKNFPLMLDTLKYLKQIDGSVKLAIIGPEEREQFAFEMARSRGLERDICYFHAISNNKMPDYYRAAEFLALPSLKEGFGIPLLESIAVGRPFVSMDVGIAPALGRHGLGSVATNEKDFMDKSAEMLKKPLVLGARGHAFVYENYSWDACARKTLAVYQKVTG